MKKIIATILIIIIVSTFAISAFADTVYIAVESGKTGGIFLRGGPGRNYEQKGVVKSGDTISVIEQGEIWSKIETKDGSTGYIKTLYIQNGDERYASGTRYLTGPAKGETLAEVNMRGGASTNVEIITVVPKKTVLNILGVNGNFFLVILEDGTQGYIDSKYINSNVQADEPKEANLNTNAQNNGTTEQLDANKQYIYVAVDKIGILNSDNDKASTIAIAKKGDPLELIETHDEWYMIKRKDKMGWIKKEYISTQPVPIEQTEND